MKTAEFTDSRHISASSTDIWNALVDPAKVAQYHLAPLRVFQGKIDGEIAYGTDEGDFIVGTILEITSGKRLVHTFRFLGLEGTSDDPETIVAYAIEQTGEGSLLTVTHSGFPQDNQTFVNISSGWPYILDSLQKLLEEN